MINYQRSENFKKSVKRYTDSIKGRKTIYNYQKLYSYKKFKKDYRKSSDGRLVAKKYRLSEKGKLNHNIHNHKRRAAKMNIIETFTIKQFLTKVELCNGICPICNKSFDNNIHKITMDHTYPIKIACDDYLRTGLKRVYDIDDVKPMCKSCNSSKGDQFIDEWLLKRDDVTTEEK